MILYWSIFVKATGQCAPGFHTVYVSRSWCIEIYIILYDYIIRLLLWDGTVYLNHNRLIEDVASAIYHPSPRTTL